MAVASLRYIQHIDMDLSERQSRALIGLLYRWRHLGRVDGHVDTNSMCSYAITDQGRGQGAGLLLHAVLTRPLSILVTHKELVS